jgi:rare lipoprotein A
MTQLEPLRERGQASWYGRRYHDRLTSIGERYDMYGMTAAHPRLPLPSYARVTNLGNGKAVTVRVNDRGPFLHGRVIDLSYAAAAKIGIAQAGSGEVELELITEFEARSADRTAAPDPTPATAAPPVSETPLAAPRPAMAATVAVSAAAPPAAATASAASQVVQIGAFSSLDNAEAARRGLEPRLRALSQALSVVREGRFYRLIAGPFADGDEALAAARQIRSMTGLEAFTRPR